jgi:hypothetical protein
VQIPHLAGLDYRYERVACHIGDAFLVNDNPQKARWGKKSFYGHMLSRSAWLFQELGGVLPGD